MKKILLFIFCFLEFTSPVWACSPAPLEHGDYEIKGGQVYYIPHLEETPRFQVEGVDIATLSYIDGTEHFKFDDARSHFYGDYIKDAHHVYYQGKVVEGVDPAHAKLTMQPPYFNPVLFDGLEPPFFHWEDTRKNGGYLSGQNQVYYFGRLVDGANGKHFNRLPAYAHPNGIGKDYMRDDRHIYLYGQKMAGDPKTAKELGYGYYLDANHLYFRGKVLEGALPDAFGHQGLFIISNGHVYFRDQQLALDADSFQILKEVQVWGIGCGLAYEASFVQDRSGIYLVYVNGQLARMDVLEPTEQETQAFYASNEMIYDPEGNGATATSFYRNGQSIYFLGTDAKNSGSLESLFAGDAKTFEVYAGLGRSVIFRDKTGFYLSEGELIKIAEGAMELKCLGAKHICLANQNALYYVFDDGTIQKIWVYNSDHIQCIQPQASLPDSLKEKMTPGMCFDKVTFYNRAEHLSIDYWKEYREALAYIPTAQELETQRLQSLDGVKVRRDLLLLEDKVEKSSYSEWPYVCPPQVFPFITCR